MRLRDICNTPCAATGLTSYRYRGTYGYIMIGAVDHADAMNEASRSCAYRDPAKLEVWDGARYVPSVAPHKA